MRFLIFLLLVVWTSLSKANSNCNYQSLKKNQSSSVFNLLNKSLKEDNCEQLISEVLKNESKEEIFKAIPKFSSEALSYMTPIVKELSNTYVDESTPQNDKAYLIINRFKSKISTLASITKYLESECPDQLKKTKACEARKAYVEIFGKKFESKYKAAIAEEEQKNKADKLNNDPEHIYKMKFCKNSNLFAVLYISPVPIESNCIYSLLGESQRLYVLQSIDDGILVTHSSQLLLSKIIFIKTKKKYADGDILQNQFLRSIGHKKYMSTIGAQKTVNAFQYLGDAEPGTD